MKNIKHSNIPDGEDAAHLGEEMAVNVKFDYKYEKRGAIFPGHQEPYSLWIDIGNTLRDGVFDHHQDSEYRSAFDCVMRRADCFQSLFDYLEKEKTTKNPVVEFHVHEEPDLDCIFSIFVIRKMITEGAKSPSEPFSQATVETFLNYVNQIDTGRGKYLSRITLYAYFCNIGRKLCEDNDSDPNNARKRNSELITEGLNLLELVADRLENGEGPVNLFNTPLENYIDVSGLKYYSEQQCNLHRWIKEYENEKKNDIVRVEPVRLWNKDTWALEEVKAAIWEQKPTGEDEYIFARDDDHCLLTVYPRSIKEENSDEGVTRVILALNPNMPEAEHYSLMPLAEVIEQCEQIEEERYSRQTQRYRRDHSCCRGDINRPNPDDRFSKIPFCETSDPWFITKEEDLIDAPRDGSILPYRRILSLVRDESFLTRRVSILQYMENSGQIQAGQAENLGMISFGHLYHEIQGRIKEAEEEKKAGKMSHLFVYVKISPSMIKYNNNWLKACCLYMVGQGVSRSTQENIHFIDYRTCLYTDQTITILTAVDEHNSSLCDLVDEEHLEKSAICKDLQKLLVHRNELKSIGKSLSQKVKEMSYEDNKIEQFNNELIRLNTGMEEADLNILDPVEQDAYVFLRTVLGIEPLRNTVTTSAQLLIENAKQQYEKREAERDGRIQAGIGVVSIFAIFSAFTDSFDFIAKFVPGTEGGWSELRFCAPAFVATGITWLLVFVLGLIAVGYTLISLNVLRGKAGNWLKDKVVGIGNWLKHKFR